MWKTETESSENKDVIRMTIYQDCNPLSFADVIESWKKNAEFRVFYKTLLADLPFEAFFWESPPITKESVNRRYEFVAVESTHLAQVEPNPTAFDASFQSAEPDETVIAFENLGRDALLLVPCPMDSFTAYTHFAKFVRNGPEMQCQDFFRRLGEEIAKRLDDKPLWINTSGLGVYWLHVRLDSRPKYYTYLPYKEWPHEV